MENNTVRHIAGEMVDLVQRCVICGYVILDYTNSPYYVGGGELKGFREGEVFITHSEGFRGASIVAPENIDVTDCKN